MNTMQYDEITNLLRTIADNSVSNKIAMISMIFAGIAVVSSIYFSYQTREQYIDGISPLLSFNLMKKSSLLYLSIKNTGQSEALDISLDFKSIKNNGDSNSLLLSELFKNPITLYPNEQIIGHVAISTQNAQILTAPVVTVDVSYTKGNTRKKVQYTREICFSENIDGYQNEDSDLKKIEESLDEISRSSNRVANYLSGNWLIPGDQLNVEPQRTLYQDIKDGTNNIERPNENLLGRDGNGRLK